MVCPLAVGLGADIPLGAAFLQVAALSVLAAIPFACLAAAAQIRWRKRNPGKAYPSWRMIVAMWFIAAAGLLGELTNRSLPVSSAQQYAHHIHHVVWLVQLALFGGAFVFWLLAVRQWSKVGTNGLQGGPQASASPHRPARR
jgi:hypothetical protein